MAVGSAFWFWWRPRAAASAFRPPTQPDAPTHDLLWADGEGITWGAGTIIDWPVI